MTNLKKKVTEIYQIEREFISDVFGRLPESAKSKFAPDPVEDEYIIDSDEEPSRVLPKKEKFQQSLAQNKSSRSLSHEELKRRLHEKIAELAKERVENQGSENSVKRKKRKDKKLAELAEKRKKFTSKANPNATSNKKSAGTAPGVEEKTPLQKKAVKKSNGEIVYSKFDFISEDKKPKEFTINTSATTPTKLLKSVEKKENMIQKLNEQGKASEAVFVAEKQKWNNALQRAKGSKVRDDPELLKKSIKKQEKITKVKQKKWKERVDMQEKQKDMKQAKRQENIQKRKDEKIKRTKKIQRKKGRIA